MTKKTKIDAKWLDRVAKSTKGLGEAPPAGRPTGRVLGEKTYINAKAREVCRHFGAECEANPGSSFTEDYAYDCALRYGRKSYAECTTAEKSEILAAFAEGRREEKKLSGRT